MTKTLKKICAILGVDYIDVTSWKQPYGANRTALLIFCHMYSDTSRINLINATQRTKTQISAYIREAEKLIQEDGEFASLYERITEEICATVA